MPLLKTTEACLVAGAGKACGFFFGAGTARQAIAAVLMGRSREAVLMGITENTTSPENSMLVFYWKMTSLFNTEKTRDEVYPPNAIALGSGLLLVGGLLIAPIVLMIVISILFALSD